MTDVMYECKTMPESISAKIEPAAPGWSSNYRIIYVCILRVCAGNFEWALNPGQSRATFLSVRNDNRK